MSAPPVLLVFAKAPVEGEVKTRLAATLGARRATAVYRELLEATLDCATVARDAGIVARVELWCAPTVDAPVLRALAERCGASLHEQRGRDLGERMGSAIAQALRASPAVLLVGTDCPVLTPALLAHATALLATHDAVVGPAEDGGYVLVGARRPLPFADVRWSTPHARADTLAGFARAGLRCAELPLLWDVDDDTDLARWTRLREDARAAGA